MVELLPSSTPLGQHIRRNSRRRKQPHRSNISHHPTNTHAQHHLTAATNKSHNHNTRANIGSGDSISMSYHPTNPGAYVPVEMKPNLPILETFPRGTNDWTYNRAFENQTMHRMNPPIPPPPPNTPPPSYDARRAAHMSRSAPSGQLSLWPNPPGPVHVDEIHPTSTFPILDACKLFSLDFDFADAALSARHQAVGSEFRSELERCLRTVGLVRSLEEAEWFEPSAHADGVLSALHSANEVLHPWQADDLSEPYLSSSTSSSTSALSNNDRKSNQSSSDSISIISNSSRWLKANTASRAPSFPSSFLYNDLVPPTCLPDDLLHEMFAKNATLEVFGSTVTNLALPGRSDVDVNVALPPADAAHLGPTYRSRLFDFVLQRISGHSRIEVVELRPLARVPVIKVIYTTLQGSSRIGAAVDPIPSIHCDITFGHSLPRYNSNLLRVYGQLDPLVRRLMLLTKHWASLRSVKDASQGFLSSYSFMILAIFYAQKRMHLPILQKFEPHILKRFGVASSADVTSMISLDNTNATTYEVTEFPDLADTSEDDRLVNQLSASDHCLLFWGFLEFLHSLSTEAGTVSIRKGDYINRPTSYHVSRQQRLVSSSPDDRESSTYDVPNDLNDISGTIKSVDASYDPSDSVPSLRTESRSSSNLTEAISDSDEGLIDEGTSSTVSSTSTVEPSNTKINDVNLYRWSIEDPFEHFESIAPRDLGCVLRDVPLEETRIEIQRAATILKRWHLEGKRHTVGHEERPVDQESEAKRCLDLLFHPASEEDASRRVALAEQRLRVRAGVDTPSGTSLLSQPSNINPSDDLFRRSHHPANGPRGNNRHRRHSTGHINNRALPLRGPFQQAPRSDVLRSPHRRRHSIDAFGPATTNHEADTSQQFRAFASDHRAKSPNPVVHRPIAELGPVSHLMNLPSFGSGPISEFVPSLDYMHNLPTHQPPSSDPRHTQQRHLSSPNIPSTTTTPPSHIRHNAFKPEDASESTMGSPLPSPRSRSNRLFQSQAICDRFRAFTGPSSPQQVSKTRSHSPRGSSRPFDQLIGPNEVTFRTSPTSLLRGHHEGGRYLPTSSWLLDPRVESSSMPSEAPWTTALSSPHHVNPYSPQPTGALLSWSQSRRQLSSFVSNSPRRAPSSAPASLHRLDSTGSSHATAEDGNTYHHAARKILMGALGVV